ncbi:uncharacterized protein LOC113314274 [Papaver somniferum]|uniref:uncharacterized protein LOC113314274 n=1 Tax=Papaver somniferum TaxID=3469 RepID=UPI000E6F572E|nr:uncharacterized protein LOC113314274 [Papaver somniferum]
MINVFACEEGKQKYSSYLLRSYIEDNKEFKWCPAPDCGLAIKFVNGSDSCDVTCDCTHSFCWNCSKEGHRPVDCGTMEKWILKNNDASEHVTWLLANFKPCPNCKRPIEKSVRCNHVKCSICQFRFCWVCLVSVDNHSCNGYKGDVANNNLERNTTRKHLAKYIHYYERWVASHMSLDPAVISMRNLEIYHQDYGFVQFENDNFAPDPKQQVVSQVSSTKYEELKVLMSTAKQMILSWKNILFTSRQRIFVRALGTTASWFHDNIHVTNPSNSEMPILLNLAAAVENHKGTAQEISALLGKLTIAYYKLLGLDYTRRIFDRGKGFQLIQVFSYYVGYYELCFYTTTCSLVLYASSVLNTEYKNSVCKLVLPPGYGLKLLIINVSVIVLVKHGDDDDSSKNVPSAAVARKGFYKQPDFVINYEDAELFIIQPYSEDNFLRIWTNTWNEKRKLVGTSHKTKEKQNRSCIVFIFFSDNASTQFCGVAEMVGSVDFDKIISYWQQDKWNRHFTGICLIMKHIPISQFCLLILIHDRQFSTQTSADHHDLYNVKIDEFAQRANKQVYVGMFVRASGLDLGGKILFTEGGALRGQGQFTNHVVKALVLEMWKFENKKSGKDGKYFGYTIIFNFLFTLHKI